MKFIKQDLLTLLIGLFLFASCKNTSNIGLDVDPNTAIQGTLVNDQQVTSQTLKEPDFNTSILTQHPIGYMVDPIFGKTESSVGMTVTPPSLSYDFKTSPVLDSAVLVLNLAPQFYGDTATSRYSIDVYQLTAPILKLKASDAIPHNGTLLGNFNSKIFPNTKIKITDIVVGGKDTARTVPAQIRIPLNKAFIQNTILTLPTTGTSTSDKFVQYFKGLYAEINKTSSTGTGGVAFLDFAGTNSYLQLVYKTTNASSGIDTVSTNFPIGTSSGTVTANINHDYTSTAVKTQLDNPGPAANPTQYGVTYLQDLGGVRTKISFPTLKNFTTTYGKAIINKAELVVDLSAGTFALPFAPSQRLSLYRWDIASQEVNLPDHDQSGTSSTGATYTGDARAKSDAVFGGYYDSLKNRYVFNVTAYVQDIIDGTKIDYGTYIAPSSLTATAFNLGTSRTTYSASRAVIGTFGSTTNRLKLNIYYTKIN